MRVVRWLIRLGIGLILLLMLFLAIIITPIGFKLSLFALKASLPGQLTYQKASGLLIGPIEIKQLQYQHDQQHIKIADLNFNWQPLQLFRKELNITQLTASQIHIITPEKANNTKKEKPLTRQALIDYFNALEPIEPTALKPPFSVVIQNTLIKQITINHPKQKPTLQARQLTLNMAITQKTISLNADASLLAPLPMSIQAKARGNLNAYQFSTVIKTQQGTANIIGKGDRHHASVQIQPSKLLNGELAGQLKLYWYPKIQWQLSLHTKQLNLEPLDHNLSKKLDLAITTTGELNKKTPTFNLKLMMETVSTKIQLAFSHQQTWQAQWKIQIPQLSSLYKTANGHITTTGTLHGNLLSPNTDGKLAGKNIQIQGVTLDNIDSQWDLHFDKKTHSHINISIKKLHAAAIKFDRIHIHLGGTNQHHRLTIKTQSGKNTMNFVLAGHYDGQIWQGHIQRFDSSAGLFGTWRLKSHTQFSISQAASYLKPLCLIGHNGGHFCLSAEWEHQKPWKILLNSAGINFSKLGKNLKLGTQLTSTLSLHATAQGDANQLTNASVKLELSKGSLTYKYAGRRVNTHIRPSHLLVTIDPKKGLQSDLTFGFSAEDQVNALVNIPNFDKTNIPFLQKKLTGNLSLNAHDFRFVSLLVPNLRIGIGHLRGNLKLSGQVGRPLMHGELKLNVPKFEYRMLQAHAKNIQATIKATGQRLDYNLAAQGYHGGPISFQGFSDIDQGFDTQFTLKTNNTQIIKNTNFDIYTTASLYFVFAHDKFNLNGDVLIPKATIKPVDFSSTLTMPENIVTYIGLPKSKQRQKSNRQQNININVKLGKDVVFDAYGINANLEGGINILMSHNTSAMGNGQIRITNGSFKAYGQSLEMAKGSSISYIQSPLSNPFIDARAFKKINANQIGIGNQLGRQTITAGVHIQGTIKNMRFNLYSQPGNISQADILSYLVLGYASNDASGANLSLLLDAANSLSDSSNGLTSPMNLANTIKSKLGIETLGIRNEAQLDAIGNSVNTQSAFVVGDRLSKRIYIEFSHGLLIPDNVFKLQYKLSDNWILQTSTGSGDNVGTGVDILYSISRD